VYWESERRAGRVNAPIMANLRKTAKDAHDPLRSEFSNRYGRLALICGTQSKGLSGVHKSPYKGASVDFALTPTILPLARRDSSDIDLASGGQNGSLLCQGVREETSSTAPICLLMLLAAWPTPAAFAEVSGCPNHRCIVGLSSVAPA
jgi:hypothetical protein